MAATISKLPAKTYAVLSQPKFYIDFTMSKLKDSFKMN